MKDKELVSLRRKPLSNGVESLFLDYYLDGVRHKEYLRMYIRPEKTKMDRIVNDETLKIAQAAKARKILDIERGVAKVPKKRGADVMLHDYIRQVADRYTASGHEEYGRGLRKVANYVTRLPKRISLRSVDKEYVMGFVRYLRKVGLADNTVHLYFMCLHTVLAHAYRDGRIDENPIARMDRSERPQLVETRREYLTLDEVELLMRTPCEDENLRSAFLFACFTGLRLSDIEALTWDNIRPAAGGGWRVEERQVKTRRIVYIPLSENAISLLPERRGGADPVWEALPARPKISRWLAQWVEKAGIRKHITFHSSRHTYATLLFTYGADIYTVMSLLGHTDVGATQIYAKIVDEKKRQAVSLIPRIGES